MYYTTLGARWGKRTKKLSFSKEVLLNSTFQERENQNLKHVHGNTSLMRLFGGTIPHGLSLGGGGLPLIGFLYFLSLGEHLVPKHPLFCSKASHGGLPGDGCCTITLDLD